MRELLARNPILATHQEPPDPITVEEEILRIIGEHHTWLEPWSITPALLVGKNIAPEEICNDREGSVTAFFDVLRDHARLNALCEAISLTPWSRHEYERALEPSDEPIEQARRLVIRMSMSRNGRFACPSHHLSARWIPGTTSMSQWQAMPQTLTALAERLKHVVLENRAPRRLVARHAGPNTLIYYNTNAIARQGTAHGTPNRIQRQVIDWLAEFPGMVILLADLSLDDRQRLRGWQQIPIVNGPQRRTAPNHPYNSHARPRLWLNPAAAEAQPAPDLFH